MDQPDYLLKFLWRTNSAQRSYDPSILFIVRLLRAKIGHPDLRSQQTRCFSAPTLQGLSDDVFGCHWIDAEVIPLSAPCKSSEASSILDPDSPAVAHAIRA